MILGKVPVEDVLKAVYRNSSPQGLGFLHYIEGEMPNDLLVSLVEDYEKYGNVNMDYLNGRACKCSVYKKDGDVLVSFTRNHWFDHTAANIENFLKDINCLDTWKGV